MKFNSKMSMTLLLVLFLGLGQATWAAWTRNHKEQGKELGDKLDKAEEKVKKKAHETKEKGKEIVDKAKEKAHDAKETGKDKVHDVIDKM